MKEITKIISQIFFSKTLRPVFWFVGFSIAIIFVVDTFVMPYYVNKGGTLIVPNVVGMKEEAAKKLLDSLHFESRRGEIRQDNTYPVGYVILQNPSSEQIVKNGRRVYLTISGGEQDAIVPSLRGRSIRDAKFALDRAGLRQGAIQYQVSAELPEGTIITQDIPAGNKMKHNSFISFIVSAGESIDSIFVPSLIGKTYTEAIKMLKDKGLRTGNITYQLNEELVPNTVIDQLPRENEIVTTQKEVDLFISQTPDKATTKKKEK
ncbi:MAG: PASTA domain-containing protein [Bacteroidota bacterium]|nr:PASTA domain-containing protein [Bacteroidota bacterium]